MCALVVLVTAMGAPSATFPSRFQTYRLWQAGSSCCLNRMNLTVAVPLPIFPVSKSRTSEEALILQIYPSQFTLIISDCFALFHPSFRVKLLP